MKSEKAKELIDSCPYLTIPKDAVIECVEIAEAEMREQAMKEYRKSCEYRFRCLCMRTIEGEPCEGYCPYVRDFLFALENPKTE